MLIYLGYCVYIYNIRTLSGDIQFICTSYIKQVEKRVLCELFWPVSQRVQKKGQQSVKWFETSRTNYQMNRFYGAYTVTVTLHETGTRNALLGS